MADEFAKLCRVNNELKGKLKEAVGQNVKFKDQIVKLNDEILELKERIKAINAAKLMEEKSTQTADSTISTLRPNKRYNNESNDLVAKMDICQFVPNWLVEVLAWIKRMEMADSFLPTSCRTFNQLCWPKLHGNKLKPHSAGSFTFSHHFDKWGNIHASIKHSEYAFIDDANNPNCDYSFGFPIPIPCVPPPVYIQNFKHITFEFLNDELIEFIKGVLPLMKNVNIVVDMNMKKWNAGDKCVALMNRLFDMLRDKILELEIQLEYSLEHFCRLFPDFLNHVKMLCIRDDIESEKEIGLLVDWLANTWRNGHAEQKCLIPDFSSKKLERNFIDRQFTNANQARLYFVSLSRWTNQMPDEFTLENKQTGEVLALYYRSRNNSN